ncbi:MAG: diaminohydroxyphosphoribosylaminopyrimidine deaminase [Acidobacteriota bacterium]|nr:diaminohydroxyphosphoribosylaminopyrimidine deaminase [Acidobacteriota bacterium]
MRRALELAARGVGQVSPSPLVGCVIASPQGEVIGEGFYVFEQISHAETLALDQAAAAAHGATAYVTLEPHAHFGRTPPCTAALIQAGIARVVAPIQDPNPLVSGRGFAHLRSAGVDVCQGLLATEASRLNEAYIYSMRHSRPFVHLKLACSLDGKIATRTGDSRWITGEESRARVHELRHQYDAILVGAGTAAADDPLLTDRSGKARRRPLLRVVLDDDLRLSTSSRLVTSANEIFVMVFTSNDADQSAVAELHASGVQVVRHAGGARDLKRVLEDLGSRSVQSVLVEGGSGTAGAFLDAGLVNKISVFIAPIIIGGSDAPTAVGGAGAEKLSNALHLQSVEIIQRGSDVEITGYVSGMRDEARDEG